MQFIFLIIKNMLGLDQPATVRSPYSLCGLILWWLIFSTGLPKTSTPRSSRPRMSVFPVFPKFALHCCKCNFSNFGCCVEILYNCSPFLLPFVSWIIQLEACVHPFFDELRDPSTRLPNGRPLPPLFNFKSQGKSDFPVVLLACSFL